MDVLQAQALRAREMGEHEKAMALWRELLRHHPDDWRLALELKRDMKAALHFPESDAQFRRAARSLPDAEWLAHYAALYAYHGEDLDVLEARARAILERQPDDHRLLAIIGDVASQRQDWAGSEAAFAAAFAIEPREEYRWKRDTAAMYQRVRPLLKASEGGAPYPIAYVGLDRNTERDAELHRQFAGSAPPMHRIPAVEGRRLSAAAVRRLGGDPHMRGTLGCFLSHAIAWEIMLDRGDEMCLIVEDDVIPLLDLPADLAALALPGGFDLIFVNDRVSPRLDPAGVDRFTIHPLKAAMMLFHPEDNAIGSDGYVLSRAGARKLLAWVEEDGFAEDSDWRMVAYGMTPEDVAALPRPSLAGPWLERLGALIRRPDRLSAYVLHPPLIRTVGVSSDREDENRLHPPA